MPASADDDLDAVAGNYGETIHPMQATCILAGATFPMRYAVNAALDHLDAWVRDGTPPPAAPRYEFDGSSLGLDEHGNARGGIRYPVVDVPVARYVSTMCGLGGITLPFTDIQINQLYPTFGDYICPFTARAADAVAAGFLLQEDADDLLARAEAVKARWLDQSADCG